jgi:SecD/SecF fusion protein
MKTLPLLASLFEGRLRGMTTIVVLCLLCSITACSQDPDPLDITLAGGTTMTVEIDVDDFLLTEADFSGDTLFRQALRESRRQGVFGKDRIAAFVTRFNELSPEREAGAFFYGQRPRIYAQSLNTEQIIKRLCERYDSMIKAAELVIGKRLTSFGTEQSKWKVSTDGKGHVIIDLAKDIDANRIRNLLTSSARIGFYETMDMTDAYTSLQALDENYVKLTHTTEIHPLLGKITISQQGGTGLIGTVPIEDTAAFNTMLKTARTPDLIRSDLHFVWGFAPDESTGGRAMFLYAIEADNFMLPPIDGKAITHATSSTDQASGQVTVNLTMTTAGSNKWSDMTQDNLGRAIAIVFEGKVLSCPNVISPINDGNTQITGNFTVAEAKELAAFLSSSPLPARMVILDMKTVKGK